MIGVIRNGMNLLAVDSFFQLIVIGVVIVLAVEADVLRSRLEARFRLRQALAREHGADRGLPATRPDAGTAGRRASPALAVRGATKRFGGVLALDDVDLECPPARSSRSSATTAQASPR